MVQVIKASGFPETGDILSDVRWLDANKDGVINSSDSGFAAIKRAWTSIRKVRRKRARVRIYSHCRSRV